MKRTLFILCVLLFGMDMYAQVDTEFWIACPKLTTRHGSGDGCVILRFITFDQEAEIRVSQPSNPSFNGGKPIVLNVSANSSGVVTLGSSLRSQIETATRTASESVTQAVRNTGILITSTSEISAYYANICDNSEIYSLKGKNALGTDFLVPMQYEYDNDDDASGSYDGWASIEIVATENDTEVKVTPTKNCVGHPANQESTIKLNRGQSYAIRASSRLAAQHFYNTRVKSNKPIAVNYTDDSVKGLGVDLIGDQLVPVNLVGKEYIAVKNPGTESPVEKVYIFPTEDNTDVYINEVKKVTLDMLTNNKFRYEFTSQDTAIYIRGTKPVTVLHVTSKGATLPELGAAVLPSIECSGSTEAAYRPINNGGSPLVSLITRKENIGEFNNPFLGGKNTFKPVPGTNDEWYYTVRNLSAAMDKPLRLKTRNEGIFHMGVFDSPGSTCSYGYFSNYKPIPIGAATSKTHYIAGDQIELSVSNPESLSGIIWTDPMGTQHRLPGTTFSNPVVVIPNATKLDEGKYIINAESKDGCLVEPETIIVTVFDQPVPTELSMCLGDSMYLTAEGTGPFTWTPADLPNKETVKIKPAEGDSTYVYTIKSYKPGLDLVLNGDFQAGNSGFTTSYTYGGSSAMAVSSPGSYTVGANPNAHNINFIDKNDHTFNNARLGKQLILNCVAGESVLWEQRIETIKQGQQYKLSAWFLSANQNADPVKVKYRINGLFVSQRDENGDIITDSQGNELEVEEFEIPADGEWHELSYIWKSDIRNATLNIVAVDTKAGSAVSIDDILFAPVFDVTDTFEVYVRDSLKPVIVGALNICEGKAELSVEGDYDTFEWSNGARTRSTVFTEPGDYSVRVTEGDCARGTTYFTIESSPEVSITLDPLPDICAGASSFEVNYTLQKGEIGTYSILFDEKAKAEGFTDIVNQKLTDNKFVINLPREDVYADEYTAELHIFEEGCGTVGTINPSSTLSFTVKYNPEILITQRWDDVLGVTNENFNGRDYTFTAYQWYKNGEELSGETGSYLYYPDKFTEGDYYNVVLTRSDGTAIPTCDFYPFIFNADDFLQIPSVVNSAQSIPLNTEISGKALFWGITGRLESVEKLNSEVMEIKAPAQPGVYILQLITGEKNKQYKILVK